MAYKVLKGSLIALVFVAVLALFYLVVAPSIAFAQTIGDYSDLQGNGHHGQGVYVQPSTTSWSYAPPLGGIVNSTANTAMKTACGATCSNRVTGGQCQTDGPMATATELVIKDQTSTILWKQTIPTGGWVPWNIIFTTPLKSSVNFSLTYSMVTASATGALYCSWQGDTTG